MFSKFIIVLKPPYRERIFSYQRGHVVFVLIVLVDKRSASAMVPNNAVHIRFYLNLTQPRIQKMRPFRCWVANIGYRRCTWQVQICIDVYCAGYVGCRVVPAWRRMAVYLMTAGDFEFGVAVEIMA